MTTGAPSSMTAPGMEWWDSVRSESQLMFLCQVGMIARDEADIGVASFYATADRAEAVDFSVVLKEAEYWNSKGLRSSVLKCRFRTKFFIKFPGRNLGGYLAFIKGPILLTKIISQDLYSGFRDDLWVFCVVFLFSVPAVLWLSVRIQKYYCLGETYDYSYTMNIFILFYTLSQQVNNQLLFNISREQVDNEGIWSRSCVFKQPNYLHDNVCFKFVLVRNILRLLHLLLIRWNINHPSLWMIILFLFQLLKWENHFRTWQNWRHPIIKLDHLILEQSNPSSWYPAVISL